MAKPYYPDWQQPAEKSRMRRAISRAFDMAIYSQTFKKTSMHKVQIIKPLHGDPRLVYASALIPVKGAKATAAMCDNVKYWKEY